MDVDGWIRGLLGPDELLVLVTDTDLTRDGRFGRRWFVVTSARLMTVADGGGGDGVELEIPLSAVKEVRTVHNVGRMELEAVEADRRVPLLSCTSTLTTRFAKVAHALTRACKDGHRSGSRCMTRRWIRGGYGCSGMGAGVCG